MAGMSVRDCVLALDFDGVIWDSVGECWMIASRTWEKLYGPVPTDEARFRAGRWLVRTGEDFYVLLRLVGEDPGMDLQHFPQPRFEALRQTWKDEVSRFDREFYQMREQVRE
ncbi:MAG: hypothetical protein ACYCW6_29205, partial [Candidatus Xenobia bacterium]